MLVENLQNEQTIDWDEIYSDLKNELAVLIIGPDFNSNGTVSVKEQLYEELTKRPDHGILHFYPNNGIFLFQTEYYKSRAKMAASKFYKALAYDETLLQKIIDLPFRMIINTNPDRSLERLYKEKNIQCQFDYFTAGLKKEKTQIEEPDKFYPLIFNLFGTVDVMESLVLDFEDIFDHLTKSLSNENISDIIRAVLSETNTFIFIGFRYEKWDTQLLFRYLNMKKHGFDDRKRNYTTKAINIDLDSESFFRQQFNLKYYGAPVDFINQLHSEYFRISAEEDKDQMEGISPRQIVEGYVAGSETEKALNYLTNSVKDETISQELTLVKSTFARYIFARNRKLETAEQLEVSINRIHQTILEISKNLQ